MRRSISVMFTTILMIVMASTTTMAQELVAQDDWDDDNWVSSEPGKPWTTIDNFNYLYLETGAGPDGSVAVRWEPRRKKKTNDSIALDVTPQVGSAVENGNWTLQWDEKWYPTDMGRDGKASSNPVVTLAVQVQIDESTWEDGEWILKRRLHPSYDATLTFKLGDETLLSEQVSFSGGFDPAPASGDTFYRYYLQRGVATGHASLRVVQLEADGSESDESWNLLLLVSRYPSPVISEKTRLMGVTFSAETTEDGFDAVVDNFRLSTIYPPANFEQFVNVDDSTYSGDLAAAIQNEDYIYLPPHDFFLDNSAGPIEINRNTPLYIVGMDRMWSRIRAEDDQQPLFRVTNGTVITMNNLRIWPAYIDGTSISSNTEVRSIVFSNETPLRFEFQNARNMQSTIEIQGPGEYVFQGAVMRPDGFTRTGLLIDHDEAYVYYTGGNINTGGSPPRIGDDDEDYDPSDNPSEAEYYHVWQKRGLFQIYGTGTQQALGEADFRIESPAPAGSTHVIADVRSEGANGANQSMEEHISSLLVVPPTSSPVDVIVKGNGQSHPKIDPYLVSDGCGVTHLVDYNAEGTLWLLGNNARWSAGTLVKGASEEAPLQNARIVAIGNRLYRDDDLLAVHVANDTTQTFYGGNTYSYREYTGNQDDPRVRFVTPEGPLAPNTPPVPNEVIPEEIKLSMPALSQPLPDMIDVTDYGATPNNPADDDRGPIQAALDVVTSATNVPHPPDGRWLYFPAGTYHISGPLYYNHYSQEASVLHNWSGGWIGGPGASTTTIERIPDYEIEPLETSSSTAVFVSQSMTSFIVQGLTFRTEPFSLDSTFHHEPNFSIDLVRDDHLNAVSASQEVMFYDCTFDGGLYGLGFGLKWENGQDPPHPHAAADDPAEYEVSGWNCSENMAIDCTFRNTWHGFAAGHANALANMVVDGTFEDNHRGMGTADGPVHDYVPDGHHGTVHLIRGVFKNSMDMDIYLTGSTNGIWYFYGLQHDPADPSFRVWSRINWASHPYATLFDNCTMTPTVILPAYALENSQAGALTLLHSELTSGAIRMNPVDWSVNAVFSLHSTITEWLDTFTNDNSRAYELE